MRSMILVVVLAVVLAVGAFSRAGLAQGAGKGVRNLFLASGMGE